MTKQEARDELIKALRSGNYEQGRGNLNDRDEVFCCLGVACEIAVKHGIIPRSKRAFGLVWYGDSQSYLPLKVMEFFGFASPYGEFSAADTSLATSLAKMNDVGVPFSEIADFIESNPPGLFKD